MNVPVNTVIYSCFLSAREKAVREILTRNVIDSTDDCFLTGELGLNPIWFYDVKASTALAAKDYETAVKHMIDGGFYNKAHNVSFCTKK